MKEKIREAMQTSDPLKALEDLLLPDPKFGSTVEHREHLLKMLGLETALADALALKDLNLAARCRLYAYRGDGEHKGFAALSLSCDYGDKYRSRLMGLAWVPGRLAWVTQWRIDHPLEHEAERVRDFAFRQLSMWRLAGLSVGFDLEKDLQAKGRRPTTTKMSAMLSMLAESRAAEKEALVAANEGFMVLAEDSITSEWTKTGLSRKAALDAVDAEIDGGRAPVAGLGQCDQAGEESFADGVSRRTAEWFTDVERERDAAEAEAEENDADEVRGE